jgi:LPS sulfotransferase NodH
MLSYLVCSIPRSGSTLLCDLLMSTAVAGHPIEYFHPSRMEGLWRRWEVDSIDDYVQRLLVERTGTNGVFGAKVHWGQYNPAFGDRDPRELFPSLRLVSIRRVDRLRQAISWVRALQSAEWRAKGGTPAEERPMFDAEEIRRKLTRIENDEAAWKRLFEEHGLAPFEVNYEQLVEHREETATEVAGHLGLDLPDGFSFGEPTIERQSDALSEEWVERYRAEIAGD